MKTYRTLTVLNGLDGAGFHFSEDSSKADLIMAGKEFPVMGKKKSRARQFTEGQINRFKADPNVRDIDKRSLRFKYAFRVKMYEAWEKEGRQGVKRVLSENGYDLKELGSNFIPRFLQSVGEQIC